MDLTVSQDIRKFYPPLRHRDWLHLAISDPYRSNKVFESHSVIQEEKLS